MFGLAFFMIARKITSLKLRDYLTITAIGDTIVGIALSTSALQQTFGIAGHSLVLLASFLFSMGLFLSVISLAQDNTLRQSIRKSMSGVIDNIGTVQMERETEKRIMKVIRDQHKTIEEQTGGMSETLTEGDIDEYMEMVLEERKSMQTSTLKK